MEIKKEGIEIVCGNHSAFFDGEKRNFFLSADKLISAELGQTYCPRTGVVRALNCETVIILEKWHGQLLLALIHFGSDDTPEVNIYGITTKFLKIFLETDDNGQWYIARYEYYDGEGNYIEEQEFYIEEKEF
jgi:hypothetical protein